MPLSDFIKAILLLCPTASFEESISGEIIIHTHLSYNPATGEIEE